MKLTVAIPTYCREALLDDSLATLVNQTLERERYELLVVDNAGRRATEAVARKYGARYLREPTLGLNHARNLAMEVCTTTWLLYLDDDIRAPRDLLARFVRRLEGADYAALGGLVTHFFASPPDRWLSKYYRSPLTRIARTDYGEIDREEYLVGCMMAIRRDAWRVAGNFKPHLDMRGTTVGRAGEDEFQQRLRRAGLRIFYDPEITIAHLVQPYKHTFAGILQLAHASGRDGIGMRGNQPIGAVQFLVECLRITTISLPINIGRWLLKPGYFWQNAVLDTLTKYCFAWGKYRASATFTTNQTAA